jgi:hypothetical protein
MLKEMDVVVVKMLDVIKALFKFMMKSVNIA